MFFDQRVLYSDNGVLTDISQSVNDFRTGTSVIPFVAAEDYIYIGTILPWSARFIEIGTANANTASISIEYYESGSWHQAVDKIDLTATSGVPLSQNGYIRFSRDRDFGWSRISESDEITALAGTDIYDLYWLRIKWSSDLSALTSIKYIGPKFSSDAALYSRYPDLNQAALKTRFATGKTTWDEQHYIAAEAIVADLKNRKMIFSADQVIDPWIFERAAVHKVAEIIYGAFGDAYINNKDIAKKEYDKEINMQFKNLDVSQDGTLSLGERGVTFGRLVR